MQLYLNGAPSTLSDFVSEPLARAVLNSLFSWARAHDDDKLPGRSRNGWWGDSFSDNPGDRFGSRLWLLSREKVTSETVARAREYAEEALSWLVEDGVASRVIVTTEVTNAGQVAMQVVIVRPGENDLTARFFDLWSALT